MLQVSNGCDARVSFLPKTVRGKQNSRAGIPTWELKENWEAAIAYFILNITYRYIHNSHTKERKKKWQGT